MNIIFVKSGQNYIPINEYAQSTLDWNKYFTWKWEYEENVIEDLKYRVLSLWENLGKEERNRVRDFVKKNEAHFLYEQQHPEKFLV